MCMSKLRRLQVIENALFHKARAQDVRNLTDRYTGPSDMSLEEAEAAMPPIPQVDVLVRTRRSRAGYSPSPTGDS